MRLFSLGFSSIGYATKRSCENVVHLRLAQIHRNCKQIRRCGVLKIGPALHPWKFVEYNSRGFRTFGGVIP